MKTYKKGGGVDEPKYVKLIIIMLVYKEDIISYLSWHFIYRILT